jgi:hypothetical protein
MIECFMTQRVALLINVRLIVTLSMYARLSVVWLNFA